MQPAPDRTRPGRVFPWVGGLNALNDPQLVPPTHCVFLEDFVLDRDGTKKLRGGQTKYNSAALTGTAAVDGGYHYKKAGSSADTFKTMAISNQAIYKADEDGTFDDITGTSFIESGAYPDFTVFSNDLIISWITASTASYTPLVWSQSGNVAALSSDAGLPDFGFSTNYNGRLAAAGDPGNKSRLYFSKLLDATTSSAWTAATNPQDPFYIDIQPNDGDKITGLAEAFGRLFAFKENSIYALEGVLQNELRTSQSAVMTKESGSVLAGKVGSVNHSVIVPTGNDVFFLSNRGAHSLIATDASSELEQAFVSFAIQDFYLNGLNHNQHDQWRGIFAPDINSVLWAVTRLGSTNNDLIMGFNIEIREWFFWNISAASLFVRDVDGILRTYAGGYDGFVRLINDQTSLSDDGSAYTAKVKTPVLDFGAPDRLKKVKHVTFFYVPKGSWSATVNYTFDNSSIQTQTFALDGGSGAILGEFVLGVDILGSGTLEPKSVPIEGVGKTFQMEITSSGVAGQDFELLGYQVDYILMKATYDNIR